MLTDNATTVAEAHTADRGTFVAFQRDQLGGRVPSPLSHRLVGQAVYLGDRRYVRYPGKYSSDFSLFDPSASSHRVEAFDDRGVPRVQAEADVTPFEEILDGYVRSGRGVPAAAPAQVSGEIRERLRRMGYAI